MGINIGDIASRHPVLIFLLLFLWLLERRSSKKRQGSVNYKRDRDESWLDFSTQV